MLLLSHWFLLRDTKRVVQKGLCLRLIDKSFSIQQGFWRWSMNMTCPILFLKFEYRTFYDCSIQRLLLLYIARAPLSSTPRPYSYISVNASFQLQKIMHYFRYLPGLMAARLGEYTNMFFLAGLVSRPRRDREEPRGPRFIGYWGLFPPSREIPTTYSLTFYEANIIKPTARPSKNV